jgi:orotate phosphoribosyltransferase
MKAEEVSKMLLEIKAVVLRPNEPFTFASGIKSPIYCDNRLIFSHPEIRSKIVKAYCQLIKKNNFDYDIIAGVATGAIASAALIAEKLKKPMIYIRSKPKDHGKENLIEGKLEPGKKVLVIEDLVSTGGSSVTAINAVKEAGAIVVACVAVYTYGFPEAIQKFADANCQLFTLTNFEKTIKFASKTGYITEDQKQIALKWNKDPHNWP